MKARCEPCNGDGVNSLGVCEPCGGRGWVISTPARDVLTLELLGPVCGSQAAGQVLDVLDANRDALVAWLVEIGALTATTHALDPLRRDPTLASWQAGYVPPGAVNVVDVSEMSERGRRLWTVNT